MRTRLLPFLCLGVLPALSTPAQALEAEIVSLLGKGDTRGSAASEWQPASIREQLPPGTFVRTGDLSQIAILLQDQTQLRLNQNSMVQIKEVSPTGGTTRLQLSQGRAWAQAKRKVFSSDPSLPPAVTVETPNATAAIRGTDWELAVDKDGVSTLTVFSGVVEFYNPQGSVSVHPNEQARAEAGKAPVKILLTNARERVQWVTAWRPQPRRWMGASDAGLETSAQAIEQGRYGDAIPLLQSAADRDAADRMLADLDLALGRVDDAIALLEKHPDDPLATALRARALLVADRAADADAVLTGAREPRHPEILLAKGDLARFNGDARGARAAYEASLAQRDGADGWYGIGRIDTEQEALHDGRAALGRAIALNPAGPGYQGELGTLETYADQFRPARAAFDAALEQQPDDYVSLTGLGILQLKQGQPDAALESFLKAGVIEPRYARGALYTGVAYYQLGNFPRAMEMFNRAAELDPRDPLPHMMMSLAAADRMDFGTAVSESRRAAELMPYLKSLNQLLNDQKGNANVGAALAKFGMEEWAQAYAYDSYTPYWAGSHLFLADRYSGEFDKNSELFMGFLTDPTVFGASNRFNTLVASPGNYGLAGGRRVSEQVQLTGGTATANGYNVAFGPTAYFVAADGFTESPDATDMDSKGDNFTVGLGFRPTDRLSLFLFGNQYWFGGEQRNGGAAPSHVNIDDLAHRADLGLNYKFAPASQVWLKVGEGSEHSGFNGTINAPGVSNFLNTSLACNCYGPNIGLGPNDTKTQQHDLQLRYTTDIASLWQLSAGMEKSTQQSPFDIALTVPSLLAPVIPDANLGYVGSTDVSSQEEYLSGRFRPRDTLLVDAAVSHSRVHQKLAMNSLIDFNLGPGTSAVTPESEDRAIDEWNPRVGLAWHTGPGQTLRLARQDWRRPASVSTLAPVDTAGIPVDDRLVALGGKLERARLQYEWELPSRTFVEAFLDGKRVQNLGNSLAPDFVSGFGLQDLQRLDSQNRLLPQTNDLWEATPVFGAAEVGTFGFVVNQQFTDRLSGSLRYFLNDSRNTGHNTSSVILRNNQVPWLPRNLVSLGTTWLPLERWQWGMTATWRDSRYTDEANTHRLDAGWTFGVRSYWETADKRLSIEAAALNLHGSTGSVANSSNQVGVQALYRF